MSVFSLAVHDRAPSHIGLSGLLQNLQARVTRYVRFQTTLNELSALSNRELDDLGLKRSMLKRVAYQAACEAK